jgi:hypothetical protein
MNIIKINYDPLEDETSAALSDGFDSLSHIAKLDALHDALMLIDHIYNEELKLGVN